MKEKLFNYFYKITNNINNHFYFGIHSTDNLNDGYMGSGTRLKLAYKKYGKENFSKEILKFFDTRKECASYEKSIVTDFFVSAHECYNIVTGGDGWQGYNMVAIRTDERNIYINKDKAQKLVTAGYAEYILNGSHHRQESKNKIRNTMTPNNSLNTRIWVNKNGVVKYLIKTKLDEYLNNGWSLGRTGYKPRKNSQGKIINTEI